MPGAHRDRDARSSTRPGWRATRPWPSPRATARSRRRIPMASRARLARRRARPRPSRSRASSRSTCWSTDHKMIAMQYMFTGMAMALIGGFFAYVFRMQMAFPGVDVPGFGLVSPNEYNAPDHQPRRDHDLLGGDAGADRGLRQLPDPADDRLRRHGVPAASTGSPTRSSCCRRSSCSPRSSCDGGGFGGAWTIYPPLSAKAEYNLTPLGSTLFLRRGRARVRGLPAGRHQLRHHRDELARARA